MLPLIPHDKANHAIWGYIAAFLAAIVAPYVGVSPSVAAQSASFAVGLAKEVYDWKWGTGFDPVDLAVTALAGTPGALLFVEPLLHK